MKKEIMEALKAKFQGVSDSILGRIAERLAKTVTTSEEVAPAVEGVTFQQVLESYGDSRATEAQQTAVKNYENKYGLKDGAKIGDGGDAHKGGATGGQTTKQEVGGEEMPSWARTLVERMDRMDAKNTTEARRQQLSKITGRLPEPLRKAYAHTDVESLTEEDFQKLIVDVTTEVDGIVQETQKKGAVFGRPSASGGGKGDVLTQEQKDAIAHRDGTAPEGQPF